MDNFTKKKLKKPKEILKSIKNGDFSITKREFSMDRTKKTITLVSNAATEVKEKVDELKIVHNRLFSKSQDE